MNYKDVILEEYIDKVGHRIFYTRHKFQSDKFYLHFSSIWHIIIIEIHYLIKKIVKLKFAIDFLIKMVYNKYEPNIGFNYLL